MDEDVRNDWLQARIEKLEKCMKHVADSTATEVDYEGIDNAILLEVIEDLKTAVTKLLREGLENGM